MLEVKSISKKYGKNQILNKVSFTLSPGECVCIVGRNGCGKTTLMQILSGAMKADAGSVRFFGKDPKKNRGLYSKFCGYVPQESPLLPELSVIDNLKLWEVDKCPNYDYILETFELKDILKKRVSTLSGGMKRRLGIACAIAKWPPILLLDEPTTALDLYYKESIEDWLSEYKKLNGIILMSTHEEKEIMFCDRCLFLKDGRLSEIPMDENTMDEIRKRLK